MDGARSIGLQQPAWFGWRRIAALLAVLGILALLSHEFGHYVHAETPDSCAFSYIANGVPPAPAPFVVPAPTLIEAAAWFAAVGVSAPTCHDPHRSARGPPSH